MNHERHDPPSDDFDDLDESRDEFEQQFRGVGPDDGELPEGCRDMIEQGKAAYDPNAPTQDGVHLPRSPAEKLIGQRFGDFELLELLGTGGMGVVYKARQLALDRIVAVKMIRTGELAHASEIARFRREAESAGRLDHRCIVPIVDFVECDGRHLIVMGYVEGGTLEEEMRDGPLSNRRAAEVVRSLADAVSHAHGKHIVHRDLKPANVMIVADGEPRILDFGLARQLDRPSETVQAVMGTAPYMSPEQASGRNDVGPLSDVYGLGAILYQVLTGRQPFRESTLIRTLKAVQEQAPERPRQLNRAIDRDLQDICLRCLAKDPKDRYPSAAALVEDLDRYLEGRPVGKTRIRHLISIFRPTPYNIDGFATRYASLLCGWTYGVTHLIVFAALQASPGDWSLATTILAAGWVLVVIETVFVYVPNYWGLQHVERSSALNWWGQLAALPIVYCIVFVSMPRTVEVLGSVVYPIGAVLGFLFAIAHAAYEGRILWFAFVWLSAALMMVAVPWLSPLLCALLNFLVFTVGWIMLQAPDDATGRGAPHTGEVV